MFFWEHETKKTTNKKTIDIGDIDNQTPLIEQKEEKQITKKSSIEERQLDLFPNEPKENRHIKQEPVKNEVRQKSLEQMILDKFSTNNTGEQQYLTIYLKIPVNYKLKEIVDASKILDLDTDKISRMLANDITDFETIKELAVKEISKQFELKFENLVRKPNTQGIDAAKELIRLAVEEVEPTISGQSHIVKEEQFIEQQIDTAENFFGNVIEDGISKIEKIIQK